MDRLAPALALLHARQEERGHLDEEGIRSIARAVGISPVELYGAVAAYPRFRLAPGGTTSSVCGGPACALADGRAAPGEPRTHCLGLCDQPAAGWTDRGARVRTAREGPWKAPAPLPPRRVAARSVYFGEDDPFEAVRAARERAPEALRAQVAESGLRGYGGAGFPAARKWEAVRAQAGVPYVVCNADESEPGCFKDRMLLDREPRRVLAGLALAAHAVGAREGIVYLRCEYGAQREAMEREVARCRAEGLLGEPFDVAVRQGAGAYVCGEETALLNSLEGKRPIPRDRPPYPAEAGLFGRPTLVQNVETLAALPAIASRGAAAFKETGPAKLFCVSGDVASPGVFELPLGTPVRDLLALAGARPEAVGAFTLGGLSGGLLPPRALDVRLDFADPARHGASLGAGGIVVLDFSRCVVRFARDAVSFFAGESCGKCFPCRIGTTRLVERLDAACRLEKPSLEETGALVEVLRMGSACGLGPSAALVMRHLSGHFGEALAAHLGGTCPAGVCGRE